MKALLSACVSLTLALGAACSSEHSGIAAAPSFDPIGSEPVSADGGAGSGSVLGFFCDQSCKKLELACGFTNAYCQANCAMNINAFPGCTAALLAYFGCLATTDIDCSFGFPQTPGCDPAAVEVSRCQSGGGLLPE